MQICDLLLLLDFLCHIIIKRLTLPRMDYEIWTQKFQFARVQVSEHADVAFGLRVCRSQRIIIIVIKTTTHAHAAMQTHTHADDNARPDHAPR